MNNFLLFVGALLAAAFAALFAVPMFVDWNQYRGVFQEQASKLVGRPVRVGDQVSLRLLPTPYLQFENVRIADSTGRFDRPLMRAEGFTLWLSVAPLLRGTIEAREVELTRPDFQLSWDETGRGNWHDVGTGELNLPFMPQAVALRQLLVSDGRISIETAARDRLVTFDAINGELSANEAAGPYRFKGTLAHNTRIHDVKLVTFAGSPRDIPFKAQIRDTASNARYEFDGRAVDLLDRPRVEGKLTGRVPISISRPGSGDASAGSADAEDAPSAGRFVDLASDLAIDPFRLDLSGLKLTFDSAGKPQQLEGRALLGWQNGLALAGDLGARWLDLDAILGVAPPRQSAEATGGDGSTTAAPSTGTATQPERISTGAQNPIIESSYLVRQLVGLLPASSKARLGVSIDQAVLSSDSIGDVKLKIEKNGEQTRLGEFSARLPGGTLVTMSGDMAFSGPQARFQGPLRLRGTSLSRFAQWLSPAAVASGMTVNRPFFFQSNVDIDNARIAAEAFRGEIAGSAFGGTMRLGLPDAEADRTADLLLRIDSDELDLSDIFSTDSFTGAVSSASGLGQARHSPVPDISVPSAAPASDIDRAVALQDFFANASGTFDLRIGQLRLSDGVFANVTIDMTFDRAGADLREITLRSNDGLELEVSGTLAKSGVKQTQEQDGSDAPTSGGFAHDGRLDIVARALQPASARLLARLLHLEEQLGIGPDALARAAPIEVAGDYILSADANEAEIKLDGQVGPGRGIVIARFAGNGPWHDRDVDLNASLTTSAADTLVDRLAVLFGTQSPAPPATASRSRDDSQGQEAQEGDNQTADGVAGASHILVRAIGKPSEGMSSTARLVTPQLQASLTGDARLVASAPTVDRTAGGDAATSSSSMPGQLSFSGEVKLTATSSTPVLRLAGFTDGAGSDGEAVTLSGRLAREDGNYRLSAARLLIDESEYLVNGELSSSETGYRFDANVQAERTGLGELLSVSLRPQAGNNQGDGATGQPGDQEQPGNIELWSSAAFDMARIARLNGRLNMKVRHFEIADGLDLADASLALEFVPGSIFIRDLSGTALSGALSGNASLTRVRGGAKLDLTLTANGLDLSGVEAPPSGDVTSTSSFATPDSNGRISGRVSGTLSASGVGLSPRGLADVLGGSGRIQISGVAISDLAIDTIERLADQVLANEVSLEPEALREAVNLARLGGKFPIQDQTLDVTVQDGRVRLAPMAAVVDGRGLRIEAEADIAAANVQVDLRLTAREDDEAGLSGQKGLGSASFLYSGPLRSLAALDPIIDVDALQRELAFRKILQEQVDRPEAVPPGTQREGRAPLLRPSTDVDTASATLPASAPAANGGIEREALAPVPAPREVRQPALREGEIQTTVVETQADGQDVANPAPRINTTDAEAAGTSGNLSSSNAPIVIRPPAPRATRSPKPNWSTQIFRSNQ